MSTATLSAKFQISVPKEVRDALGLVPGQKLAFIHIGCGIRLIPQPALADLIGMARGEGAQDLRERSDVPPAPTPARKPWRRSA
jgi:AbrB family looped-hinge helix DNA binding protein